MKICFCGGVTRASAYPDQFFASPLLECADCGTLLIDREPSADELTAFYSTDYSEDRDRFVNEAYFEVMRRRAAAQIVFIGRHMNLEGARVLDYGCGYGMLLDALRDAGAVTSGFDHDPKCLEMLRGKGHDIVGKDVLDEDRDWDLICFSHVIEHLPTPQAMLKRLRMRSRHLFIELPRYDARLARQFDDQEGHLWFFTQAGAEALVKGAGWELLEGAAAGPPLADYWSTGMIVDIKRRIRRKIVGDWFFNQYERQETDGMWIRLMATRVE